MEWKERAESLFHQSQFEHAEFCFERAKLFDRAMEAKACRLRIEASRMAPSPRRNSAFCTVASIFLSCAQDSKSGKTKEHYFDAAQCSENGSDFMAAVEAYVLAEKYSHAVSLAAKRKWYEQALDLIGQHEIRIRKQDRALIAQVTSRAKAHYADNRDFK